MSSLQLGLIVAGVALVVGVLIYNWWQERRVRRRIREAFHDAGASASGTAPRVTSGRGAERVEPTLAQTEAATVVPANPPAMDEPVADDDAGYEPPLDDPGEHRHRSRGGGGQRCAESRAAGIDGSQCSRSRSRHRVHRVAAACATDQRRRPGGRAARAHRQAAPLVRPARPRRGMAAPEVRHGGRILRGRGLPAAGGPRRRSKQGTDRRVRAARGQRRVVATGGVRAPRFGATRPRARSRSTASARTSTCRSDSRC